ncbi:hypothetical protein Franean1_6888 [Parafrankia sp. EAN1pec]|uniref:hypothetical protein n=1 Tax=Parafrankia sp. (strain EAN1pec) TaxID=298653 RepID=UPI0000544F7C|nr:hypothetical protein Franean1_6888 [Frankia sp. EAN1pec]
MRRGSRSLRNTGSPAVVLFAGLTFALTGCGGGNATPGAGGPVGAAAAPAPGSPATLPGGGGTPSTVPGTEHRGNAGAGAGAAASAPPSASAPVVAGAAADGVAVDGTWRGSYACAQGATGLSLRIAGTDLAALTAVFDFYPLPENPAVPRGSFTMTGSVQGGRILLAGHEWVSRPAGYEMVNLTGTPRAGTPDRIEGDVDGVGGCTGFSVERATPAES